MDVTASRIRSVGRRGRRCRLGCPTYRARRRHFAERARHAVGGRSVVGGGGGEGGAAAENCSDQLGEGLAVQVGVSGDSGSADIGGERRHGVQRASATRAEACGQLTCRPTMLSLFASSCVANLAGDQDQVRGRRVQAGRLRARRPPQFEDAASRRGRGTHRCGIWRQRRQLAGTGALHAHRGARQPLSGGHQPGNIDLHLRPTALLASVRHRRGPARSAYRPQESTSPPARRG